MRKLGLIAVGFALGTAVACSGSAPPEQGPSIGQAPDQAAAETAVADDALSTPELYDRLNELQLDVEQAYLDKLFNRFDVQLQPLPQRPPLPPGTFKDFERGLPLRENWMNCTRYLTNNAAAGFCEETPPANWSPFMFNGRPYFVVPLGPRA